MAISTLNDEFPLAVTGKIQKFRMCEFASKELGLEAEIETGYGGHWFRIQQATFKTHWGEILKMTPKPLKLWYFPP